MRHTGVKEAFGTISEEIGGSNGMQQVLLAGRLGKPHVQSMQDRFRRCC